MELKRKYGASLKEKLRDPAFFIEEIMGIKLTYFQKEWLDLVENNDYVSIMAFRTCLDENTLVFDRNGNCMKIKDYPNAWFSGVLDAYKVTFEDKSQLLCTYNHRLFTEKGFLPLCKIKNERIAILKEFPKFGDDILEGNLNIFVNMFRTDNINFRFKITNNLAKLIGYLTSDGYFNKAIKIGQSIKFTNTNKKLIDEVKYLVKTEFPELVTKEYKKGKGYDLIISTGQKVCFPNRLRIIGKLLDFDDRFPRKVFNFSKENVCYFLNRLYAGDGCIYISKKNYVSITLSCGLSKQFALYVKMLLKKLGIHSYIKRRKSKLNDKIYDDEFDVKIEKAEDILKFFENVGFIYGKESKSKQAYEIALKQLEKYPNLHNLDDIFKPPRNDGELMKWVKIKKIEYVGKRKVYDI